MTKIIPNEVQSLLNQLSHDKLVVGECPICNESSPLPNWNLFYMDSYPVSARDAIDSLLTQPAEAKDEFTKLKLKLTTGAAEKSVVVNVGKVVEEVAPGLTTFPYLRADCRSLLDPIDYVVFDGLSTGQVSCVHFADVKTGAARLNDHQKQVKQAVEGHKVEYEVY
jgi:predicted Holliday junction resolvase-like endonuclease